MGCTTSESQGLCFCRICTSKHLCLFPLYSQLHTYLICYEETRYRAINLRKIPHRKKKCLFYFNSLARAAGPNNSLLVSWQLITLCSCWESLEIFYHSHTFVGSWRKQGNSRKKNIYFCFREYYFWECQSTLPKKPYPTWENLPSLWN